MVVFAERGQTMIFGLSLETFTYLHVSISLIAIFAGLVVVIGMIGGTAFRLVAALFLITTALTSITGFFFPFKGVTPAIVLGILSLIVLAVAVIAKSKGETNSAWRGTYVISSVVALYFNFFVLIVQSFEKVPSLHVLAPTQSELPFKIAQLLTLLLFILLATIAFRRFRFAE